MSNVPYVVLRLARRFSPESLVRFMLRHSLVIRPGLETRDPDAAVARYQAALSEKGINFQGKRILVLGYGGSFAVAVRLLRLGARHVSLCDPFARPDERRNRTLLPEYSDYLERVDEEISPREEWITLVQEDIRLATLRQVGDPFDLILSTSVYEHLDDLDAVTATLVRLLKAGGNCLCFIDLRDHYFRRPFEMLCYSPKTWKRWLNPSSNLNRLRLVDYDRVFRKYFASVEITVLDRNLFAFQKAKSRIRPEFLTGDDQIDSVELIRVLSTRAKIL